MMGSDKVTLGCPVRLGAVQVQEISQLRTTYTPKSVATPYPRLMIKFDPNHSYGVGVGIMQQTIFNGLTDRFLHYFFQQ
jgi:hypothetical protein